MVRRFYHFHCRKMEIEHDDRTTTKNDDKNGDTMTSDDNEAISCPLFMDGLPSDFSTNPALAAIASLMMMNDNESTSANDDDNDDDDDSNVVTAKKSSTERIIVKRHTKTKYKPYIKSNRTTKQRTSDDGGHETGANPSQVDRTSSNDIDTGEKISTTTIGEASLFLKMWKL
jgi:hypothetical protein